MKLMRIAALLGACALILSACTTEKTQPAPLAADALTTPVPDHEPEDRVVTELVWPQEDYAALDEDGQTAYRQAVEDQLALDEYVLLPDGSVAENPQTGRYDPRRFWKPSPKRSCPGSRWKTTLWKRCRQGSERTRRPKQGTIPCGVTRKAATNCKG